MLSDVLIEHNRTVYFKSSTVLLLQFYVYLNSLEKKIIIFHFILVINLPCFTIQMSVSQSTTTTLLIEK